jgi:hypothetical protein
MELTSNNKLLTGFGGGTSGQKDGQDTHFLCEFVFHIMYKEGTLTTYWK